MRRVFVLAGLFVVATFAAPGRRAFADDPPSAEETRVAEDPFVLGRFADVADGLLSELRDGWWRPVDGRKAARPTGPDSDLRARRLAWIAEGPAGSGPFPVPGAGETEPYPRAAALVLDRQRREMLGGAGLPDAGPLKPFAKDPSIGWFVENMARPAFLGPQRDTWPPEVLASEQKEVEEREAVAARNRLLAIGSVLALVGMGIGLAFAARPKGGGSP